MYSIIKKFVIGIALVVIICLELCGCRADSNKEEIDKALCFVIGSRSCNAAINYNSNDIMAAVSDVISSYGYISVVTIDGSPDLVMADSYDIPDQYKDASETILESDIQLRINSFLQNIQMQTADTAEVDVLKALEVGLESFSATSTESEKTMVVIDSGLQTTGLVNFCEGYLDDETVTAQSIADFLLEKCEIPDFSGVNIEWYNIGKVASPQSELTGIEEQKLKEIWKAIIVAGGGSVKFKNTLLGQNINESLPNVTTVSLKPLEIDFPDIDTVFHEDRVNFKGDLAVYVDEEKAVESLTPLADYLISHPNFKVLVVGTTAEGDEQFCIDLSTRRAQKVCETLISLGACENQITNVIGLGYFDKWHIEDRDSTGNQIEDIAKQNRKVVVLDASSEDAIDILKNR